MSVKLLISYKDTFSEKSLKNILLKVTEAGEKEEKFTIGCEESQNLFSIQKSVISFQKRFLFRST
jgi:hypothetical protein